MVTEQEQEVSLPYIISDLNTRIRAVESKYNLLSERLLITNQNMIDEYKKILKETKIINTDLKEIKMNIIKLKNAINDILKEMEVFAKKEHLKVLEKYINIWNPLNFVTAEEVNRIIEEKLEKGDKTANKRASFK